MTDPFLTKIGDAVRGLDVQKALADRNLPGVQRALTEAQTEWQLAGFTGTPAFLLGPTGRRLSAVLGQNESRRPSTLMSQRIDDALKRAR